MRPDVEAIFGLGVRHRSFCGDGSAGGRSSSQTTCNTIDPEMLIGMHEHSLKRQTFPSRFTPDFIQPQKGWKELFRLV